MSLISEFGNSGVLNFAWDGLKQNEIYQKSSWWMKENQHHDHLKKYQWITKN